LKVRNDISNMIESKLATGIFFKYASRYQSEGDEKGGVHVLLDPLIIEDFDLLVLFSAGWYIDKNHRLSLDNTLPEREVIP
jgi:hypothetical protein